MKCLENRGYFDLALLNSQTPSIRANRLGSQNRIVAVLLESSFIWLAKMWKRK